MKSFASDNYASVHPRILRAIEKANEAHTPAYGADPWTAKVNEHIKNIFGPKASAFPVFNGSGANVVGLTSLAKRFEAVLCTDVSHINQHECQAPELIVGAKLIDVPAVNGKLTPTMLEPFMVFGDEHQAQPRVLCLTQSTERGTVYKMSELKALGAFAKKHSLKVCMDGARFSNAVAALKVKPAEIVRAANVDVLSFGGTKNGLMLGELVVVLNPALADEMKFYRKQCLQLASKMRFISAQFCEYFEKDLWLENARRSNQLASLLASKLKKFSEIKIVEDVDTNMVFPRTPRSIVAPLQKKFPFYVWDEKLCEHRWMCSFDTTEEDINSFVAEIEKLLKKSR